MRRFWELWNLFRYLFRIYVFEIYLLKQAYEVKWLSNCKAYSK